MKSDPSRTTWLLTRWYGLLQAGSTAASVVIAVALGLALVLVVSGVLMIRTDRVAQISARRQQVATVADLLAYACERALAESDLATARLLISDAAQRYQLGQCRIVGPGGGLLADAGLSLGTLGLDGADWPVAKYTEPSTVVRQGVIHASRPLVVPELGVVQLEVAAGLGTGAVPFGGFTTSIGAMAAAGLAGLLLTGAYFRFRLRSLDQIRNALRALYHGETDGSALAVRSDHGEEATAWNRLLEEQQRLRRQAAVRNAQQSLGASANGESELLVRGCDAMSQGLLLIDEQLHIKYANNAAAVFLGSDIESMRGPAVGGFLADDRLNRSVEEAVGVSRRRAAQVVDRRQSGGSGVLRFNIRPVRKGDPASAMIVIEDITQQRVAEEASHQFVTQATHELRTPLTNIRLYLESALDNGHKDSKEQANCLNVINQETGRLERLVGDLLSVSEIEAGSLQLDRDDVRIDKILRDIETDFQAQASEKQISISYKLPPKLPVLQADRDKLVMAVHNLVGNAMKYTPEKGRVSVTAEAIDGTLTVEISDTGIGIAPDDIDRIFDKFYRAADKRISGVTGSGLGLALAREIVRLHGGDITVESEADRGSTFTLTIPFGAEAAAIATE